MPSDRYAFFSTKWGGMDFASLRSMKRRWILLIILAVLIAAPIIYFKLIRPNAIDKIIAEKIHSLVKESSGGLYILDVQGVRSSVTDSKLILSNIHLHADSSVLATLERENRAPNDIFDITLDILSIDGINIDDLLGDKQVDLDLLLINKPAVKVYHRSREYNKEKIEDSVTLYQRLSKTMKRLSVKNIAIADASFVYFSMKKNREVANISHVNVALTGMLIDSLTQNDTSRFMYAEDAYITCFNYETRTPDSLYILKVDSFNISAAKRIMKLSGIAVVPRGNKAQFSRKLKFMKDRYDLTMRSAQFNNIDWWSYVNEDGLWIDRADLYNGKLEVYCDRSLPNPPSKLGNYPHQLLKKIGLPITIRELKVHNLDVVYKEFNPASDRSGAIYMNNAYGEATNITNIPEQVSRNSKMTVKAKAIFMEQSPVEISFVFDLARTDEGVFYVDAVFGETDTAHVNKISRPLGLFELKKGTFKKLDAHLAGSNFSTKGTILFVYEDMVIKLLKEDDGELKKHHFLSFVVNKFFVKRSNLKERNVQVSYERDVHKSFFNMLWKTIMQGMIKTARGKN